MALLQNIDFIGSLGPVSAYRMRGVKKTVLRQKGGPTKEQIKTSARFAVSRLNMSEFAGCTAMGKAVRRALLPIKGLADYNISGPINKLMKIVQRQDTVSVLGQRSILLSKHPRILEGFSLNENNPFDSLVRNALTFSLDRETHSARVDIPALIRDINFFPNNNHAMFRITVALGVVPDFVFNDATKRYESPAWDSGNAFAAKTVSTPWYTARDGSPETTLEVALDHIPPDGRYSMILSIGICFGALYGGGVVEQVKRFGAAKVLALRSGDTPVLFTPDDEGQAFEEVTPMPPQAIVEREPEVVAVQAEAGTMPPQRYVYTMMSAVDVAQPHHEVNEYGVVLREPLRSEHAVAIVSISCEDVQQIEKGVEEHDRLKHRYEPASLSDHAIAECLVDEIYRGFYRYCGSPPVIVSYGLCESDLLAAPRMESLTGIGEVLPVAEVHIT